MAELNIKKVPRFAVQLAALALMSPKAARLAGAIFREVLVLWVEKTVSSLASMKSSGLDEVGEQRR